MRAAPGNRGGLASNSARAIEQVEASGREIRRPLPDVHERHSRGWGLAPRTHRLSFEPAGDASQETYTEGGVSASFGWRMAFSVISHFLDRRHWPCALAPTRPRRLRRPRRLLRSGE